MFILTYSGNAINLDTVKLLNIEEYTDKKNGKLMYRIITDHKTIVSKSYNTSNEAKLKLEGFVVTDNKMTYFKD